MSVNERRRAESRCAAAERLLRERGIPDPRVRVAGHEREIAAVAVPIGALSRLGELAGEVKALGFEYVAVDLTAAES